MFLLLLHLLLSALSIAQGEKCTQRKKRREILTFAHQCHHLLLSSRDICEKPFVQSAPHLHAFRRNGFSSPHDKRRVELERAFLPLEIPGVTDMTTATESTLVKRKWRAKVMNPEPGVKDHTAKNMKSCSFLPIK